MDGLGRFLRHAWTIRISRILLGLVFIAAALPKIGDAASFAAQIHNYRMVPVVFENVMGILIPWIELVVGLALVLGVRARAGSLAAGVLMIIFTVAVGQAVARGLDIECGCFGTGDGARVGFLKLLEDGVYLALAAIGLQRID
jgi:uncharacterized membrane protein YphA (DoxX/SURF4 family)